MANLHRNHIMIIRRKNFHNSRIRVNAGQLKKVSAFYGIIAYNLCMSGGEEYL